MYTLGSNTQRKDTFNHLIFLAFLQILIKLTVCVIYVHMFVTSIWHRFNIQ